MQRRPDVFVVDNVPIIKLLCTLIKGLCYSVCEVSDSIAPHAFVLLFER